MTDWKEMYINLLKDTNQAIRALEKSQEACEELYLRGEGLLLSSTQDEVPVKEQQEGTEANG